MTDYVYIQIAMPLKDDAPDDLVELVGSITSYDHASGDRASPAALTSRIDISFPEIPQGADPIDVRDGWLYMNIMSTNVNREHRIETEDEVYVETGRSKISHLFELLSIHCAAPSGTVIGALQGDWSYSLGGPIIVLGSAIGVLESGTDGQDHGWGWAPSPVMIRSIPHEVADRLVPGTSGWADYRDEDIDEIVAWASAQKGD